MPNRLPARIDPAQLARSGSRLSGALALAGLERLAAQCATQPDGHAVVELGFRADGERVLIEGVVEAAVPVICQRCLEPMQLALRADVRLCSVGDAHEELPEGFEPLEHEGETVTTSELVEDELLLALPGAPMHPADVCAAPGTDAAPETPESAESPFAGLRELLDGKSG